MSEIKDVKSYNYEFDFSLKINDNILVYREFNIKNYNDEFRESLEAKELMDELMGVGNSYPLGGCGIIPNVIKKSSMNYLWENFNPNKAQSIKDSMTKDNNGKEDYFTLEIRKKIVGDVKEVILSSGFSGDLFNSKSRVKIDIKDELPNIIETMRYYMSKRTYTRLFNNVKIERFNRLSKHEINIIDECR